MNNISFKPFGLGLSTDKDMYFDLAKTSPTLSTITSEASSESDNNEDTKKQSKKKMNEEDKKQKNLYKTELCRNWEETNHCRYGTKCQYAHGAADLRVVERHPKYKTQKCRTFHQTGSCPYGSRCTFRHFNLPGDDIKFNQEKQQELVCPMQQVKQETSLVCPMQSAKVSTTWSFDEDSLLPSNAESLLPHQLLSDLESPDEEPIRRCPLRNYINLPNFSQAPHYLPANHPSSSEDCKPFFHPWLF